MVYHMSWKYSILQDLYNAVLRGRLSIFIDYFCTMFFFKSYRTVHPREMAVSQGSILSLSLTLFSSLNMNSSVISLDFKSVLQALSKQLQVPFITTIPDILS